MNHKHEALWPLKNCKLYIVCTLILLNMIQNEEVPISARVLQWRCVESKVDSECLHYGRFAISPFRSGQANIIGIVMRRTLLGGVKGTYPILFI